jgi:hypothetical protein
MFLKYSMDQFLSQYIIGKRSPFFIVGLGRSGTKFLQDLLSKSDNINVYHEFRWDFDALVNAYWDTSNAYKYIQKKRLLVMAWRILFSRGKIYGEVNSLLRYHVEPLQNILNAQVFHLVRDPRDVVRSIMNRRSFTTRDKHHTGKIRPKDDDEYYESWPQFDRFEKVCWYWMITNKYLLGNKLPILKFEELISSFDYININLFEKIPANVSKSFWDHERRLPKNISLNETFPHWKNWSSVQQKKFKKICGCIANQLGYQI